MFSNNLSSSQRVNRLKGLLYFSARGSSRVKLKKQCLKVELSSSYCWTGVWRRLITLEGCGLLNV